MTGVQTCALPICWGGYESLIIPKCAGFPHTEFDATNEEHKMIRLYVGQEEAEYIIGDLEKGFKVLD